MSFTADTERMRRAADRFRKAGDETDEAAGVLATVTVPAGAFGASGPGPGIAAVLDDAVGRRTSRLRDRRARLADIAERIDQDADAYDETDASSAVEIERAGGVR
ncbi:hypothetical protein [Saccharothrix obliqua]|uniref:hypothetical protein n=1 Tax=Saccharothrix obliqua TaxID=2861747 RepID=UPI001C605129|nr:hypothetical protein [Saccharothrix obliqua]MBW4719736.1 hypothetical protein [Saccharothrix obliqua]